MVDEHKKKLFKQTATTLRFLIKLRDTRGCLAQLNSYIPKKKKKETAEDNKATITGSFQSCVFPPNEAPVTNDRLAINSKIAPTKSICSNFFDRLSLALAPRTRL